jgi:hypothetical protein
MGSGRLLEGLQAHTLHVGQQQRDISNPLRPDCQVFIHLISISASLDCVQMYANREYSSLGKVSETRPDGIVPRATHALVFDVELLHLDIGNLLSFRIRAL